MIRHMLSAYLCQMASGRESRPVWKFRASDTSNAPAKAGPSRKGAIGASGVTADEGSRGLQVLRDYGFRLNA